jgi:hyperosmotically inducible periplasmic protein
MMDSMNRRRPATAPDLGHVLFPVMKPILIMLLCASTALAQAPSTTPHATLSPAASPSVSPMASPAASASAKPEATKPDNTKKNAEEDLTAEQQGGSPADREMTKNIRRAIVKTDSLSSMAKNIKVITIDGKVTLKGPVHSEQEKTAIGSLAEKAAGKGKVINQLEVKK